MSLARRRHRIVGTVSTASRVRSLRSPLRALDPIGPTHGRLNMATGTKQALLNKAAVESAVQPANPRRDAWCLGATATVRDAPAGAQAPEIQSRQAAQRADIESASCSRSWHPVVTTTTDPRENRMQLKTILNRIYKFPSFVYERVDLRTDEDEQLCVDVHVRSRAHSRPLCSGCVAFRYSGSI